MLRRSAIALAIALALLAGSGLARARATWPAPAAAVAPVVPDVPPAPSPALPAFASPGGQPAFVLPVASSRIDGGFSRIHPALDFSVPTGAPVLASEGGQVIFAGWSYWGYGNLIVLDHGDGWQTWYGHLHRIEVEEGQQVVRSQLIGQVGNTGNSTGAHLHFEIRRGCAFHHLLTGEVLEDGIAPIYNRDPWGTLVCPRRGD